MKKIFIVLAGVLCLLYAPQIATQGNESFDIVFTNIRHAYYRNETVTFTVNVRNASSAAMTFVIVSINLSPVKSQDKTIKKLASGETTTGSLTIDCSLLKPGDYTLEAKASSGGRTVSASFEVTVAQPPNPQRLPVVYWGSSSGMMDWGLEHGFNTFEIGGSRTPLSEDSTRIADFRDQFEKAIRRRANLGIYFYTVSSNTYKNHPEVFSKPREEQKKGEVIDNQQENTLCLREPYVVEYSDKVVRDHMKLFSIYPSFYQSLINSEFRGSLCYSDRCRALLKQETGLNLYDYNVDPLHPPKTQEEARTLGLPGELIKAVPIDGVIEDNNPYYRFYMWWWKRGMGDVLLDERMAKVIREYRNDVMTWHDPYRLAPVYGRHKGLDCIGQWTYTHPDPKYTAYIETLITGAGPENQKVMPDVTTWEYQNWLAPSDSGVVFIPDHILRENCWIALSRRPDSICHYIASSFNPLKEMDSWHRDPKAFEMMTWMSENVYKPYGPFILQMERVPRKAAVLTSASSVLFPEVNRGGWPNLSVNPFYSLLMMAHIPTDQILDETIMNYGLDRYDILFLYQCETLTRSVFDKILAFKKRGGIVIGDRLLRAGIPLDYRCDFTLDHRNRQLADLVLKGDGVTADEDKAIMADHAGELRRVLEGKAVRSIDSESQDVVFNVLQSGPVRYVFMINDLRTYGERFGRWKTFHEKGLSQKVTASLFTDLKNPVLYDVREHARIPVRKSGTAFQFTRELGPCDGTIVAVYPESIEKVTIDCPATVTRGKKIPVTISVMDSGGKTCGTQPVFVRLTDPSGAASTYTDYYATTGGKLRLDITIALNENTGIWNIEASDLTSGLKSEKTITVR